MLAKLRKLRGRGLDELRVRSGQALNAFAERRGWSSLAKLPSDKGLLALLVSTASDGPSAEALLPLFRTRLQPEFFASFRDREATVRELRRFFPSAEKEIFLRADRIRGGIFDLLGLQNLSFGQPVDWHLEPQTGKRAPTRHWSRLDELDAETAGDKKIVWELNRHQHFIALGQAYWLSSDERYAQAFVSHLDSWMDANPPKLGIHWASSLEIAFRSIAWLWAFQFFRYSDSLSSATFTRALKFLYLKARHLEAYLSTYFSPNTHLTGEALGLFYLGALLPEFKEAQRWREKGMRILLEQLPIHVREDGVYFEQSSYYHRYTTEFYVHLFVLLKQNREEIPPELAEKLSALLDHLMYITRPDGTTPFFGDDDGGRLLPLHPRPANDFRATLATGAALLGRPDYKFVAGGVAEETLWLLGPDALRALAEMEGREPAKTSAAFVESGYFVMREDWSKDSNYLLFDCGPHGALNCGHAHADALSFELVANGSTMLVDPGTFTYTGSEELRDWYRGSFSHNTLTIDGESSSSPAGPFSWHTVAQCELENWISRSRFDYVAGRHNGYQRLADPVAHTRSILFLKQDYWIIRDQVSSKSEHRADVWFHFDTLANPIIEAPDSHGAYVSLRDADAGLDISCFGDGQWRREDASVSHCYAQRDPARVYAFSSKIKENGEIITFLLPQFAGTNQRVREIEAIGGRAFEVAYENGLDVVMIRTAERVETARLASDFAWSWVRFARTNDRMPQEFVLLDGQNLVLEGREILTSERRIGYLAASSLGDTFRVETDERIVSMGLPIRDLESRLANSDRQSAI